MRLFVARTLAVFFSLSVLGALVIHASCTHAQDSITSEPQQAPLPPPTATTPATAAETSTAAAKPTPAPAPQAVDDDDRFLPATKAAPVFVPRKSKSTKPIPQQQQQQAVH